MKALIFLGHLQPVLRNNNVDAYRRFICAVRQLASVHGVCTVSVMSLHSASKKAFMASTVREHLLQRPLHFTHSGNIAIMGEDDCCHPEDVKSNTAVCRQFLLMSYYSALP